MSKINFPNLDLLLQIQLPENAPWWAAAVLSLVATALPIWVKVKGDREKRVDEARIREEEETKRVEEIERRIKEARKKDSDIREDKVLRLIKANTALSTALVFILREIEDSPENKMIRDTVKSMIEQNLHNDTERQSGNPTQ